MSDDIDSDKIEIFLSDDQKIKAVGEILTNNSSRMILQLLFEEELTASEISLKLEISLQLVKYHLNKMQQVGTVKVSRIGKNIKSHDMKYYKATKFAIVILPAKVSSRARQSRSLIRSFNTIYKFAGVGVAAVAGLFAISFLQEQSKIPSESEYQEADKTLPVTSTKQQSEGSGYLEESTREVSQKIRMSAETDANPTSDSGMSYFDSGDLLMSVIIVAAVLGGFAAYFFFKARKYSSMQKL